MLLFEQIEGNMAQHREVFGAMLLAQLVMIFLKSDIQDPMQSIFDAPVTAFTL